MAKTPRKSVSRNSQKPIEQYEHKDKQLIEDYEELLEDIHDLAMIAERKDESAVSFEEIKEKLKADGLI